MQPVSGPHLTLFLTLHFAILSHADQYHFRSRPEIEMLHYVVPEHTGNSTMVADIMADARLSRLYPPEVLGQFHFRFLSSPPLAVSIDGQSGVMRTAGEIDREAVKQCRRLQSCLLPVDVAISPAAYFRIIRVTIEIADINDHAPYFPQSTAVVRVRESAKTGSSYSLPVALDGDGPLYSVQRYELTSPTSKLALVVESRDSRLVPRLILLSPLDRESEEVGYHLRLSAYDGGLPTLAATVDIDVIVVDTNDHSPVFESESYEVELLESVPVGSVVVRVQVSLISHLISSHGIRPSLITHTSCCT